MKKPREPAPTKVLLHTVQQACAALNIGVTKLYEEIAAGRLAAVKDGRNTKIPDLSLTAYAEALPAWQSRRKAETGGEAAA